jgi:hypothetical protein
MIVGSQLRIVYVDVDRSLDFHKTNLHKEKSEGHYILIYLGTKLYFYSIFCSIVKLKAKILGSASLI